VFVQASQFLRIITFYSTQLPGPNYHCREVWWLVEANSSFGVRFCYKLVTMRYDYDL